MWPLLAVVMISHSVPHGPFNEDVRYRTLTGVVQEFVDTTDDAEESPLFMSFMDRAIAALGWSSMVGELGVYKKVLDKFKQEPPFRTKGGKTNYNRFMGAISKGTEVMPRWPSLGFALVHCVMKLGMASQARLAKVEVNDPVAPEDSANASSTSDAKAAANERMAQMKKQNQLVVAAVTMSDELNEKRHRSMMIILKPWLAWHSRHALELLSVTSNRRWLLAKLNGDFMATCGWSLHEAMTPAQALDAMGFWKPLSTERNISPVVLETQNSFALTIVHLGLNMFGLRMRRMPPYFAWVECKASLIYRGSRGTSRGEEDENTP